MKRQIKERDFKLMKITSTSFRDNGPIPVKYTCDGINISPPLDIEHIPDEAKSLAIIADDPDAPIGTWVHWVMWNMPVTHHVKENQAHGTAGMNDFQQRQYGGPCPPSGTHRYFFKVYALDAILDLPADTNKLKLKKEMSDHIIAFGELVGVYKRNK
jgi:Raf kinase inhibitor-like YbhB/YbcL family protein